MAEVYLEMTGGSGNRQIPLDCAGVVHIGRGEPNEIALNDNLVSRRHAMVECSAGGEFRLLDLGSRNGTLLNGRRVTAPAVLRSGDRITVGGCEFRFQGPPEEVSVQEAAGETVVGFSQRLTTVLVVDIRDFTGLSARLAEVKLSQVISTFMREAGVILAGHGAFAQKYIGDAAMAIWLHSCDTPTLGELTPVFAALKEMVALVGQFQRRCELDAPVRIGAGVNTGLACIGNMGSEASSDYTALSDAVNLAFRLESATKELGCDLALGRSTYDLLSRHASLSDVFQVHNMQLKGYRAGKEVFAATYACLDPLLDRLGALRAHA